ncbi:response regulator [Gleimia hominis]|uniref:Response regulator n=1 Tax=Gleimia hominis TaxID=595468 RepID=A0ABU3IBJ7_9ACTO|nr:response regulator [Gleimia hominis]MDT3767754.1 response regulator [Gleimia hominis]WIK65164.1 response regulator [Gleimia hominis]
MSEAQERTSILLYSDNSERRAEVIKAIGIRPAAGLPRVEWTEAATAAGGKQKFAEGQFDLVIADGETQKTGGMAFAHELRNSFDEVPPILILTARQQDEWLARSAGSSAVVCEPLDPIALEDAVAKLLTTKH